MSYPSSGHGWNELAPAFAATSQLAQEQSAQSDLRARVDLLPYAALQQAMDQADHAVSQLEADISQESGNETRYQALSMLTQIIRKNALTAEPTHFESAIHRELEGLQRSSSGETNHELARARRERDAVAGVYTVAAHAWPVAADASESISPPDDRKDVVESIFAENSIDAVDDRTIEQLREADYELAQKMLSGDRKAGAEFYEKYYRLIGSVAWQVYGNHRRTLGTVTELDDLIQETWLYALGRVPTYAPSGGTRLAGWMINFARHKVRERMFEHDSHGTSVSHATREILQRRDNINAARAERGRRPMRHDEVAAEFNLSRQPDSNKRSLMDIYNAMLLTGHMGSLDRGYSPGVADPLGNGYTVDEYRQLKAPWSDAPQSAHDQVVEQQLKNQIELMILRSLTERQACVIRLHFGLGADSPQTLEAIGNTMGLTKETVRRIESEALQSLRHPVRSTVLRTYLHEYE